MAISMVHRALILGIVLGGVATGSTTQAQAQIPSSFGLEQGQTPPFQVSLLYEGTHANAGPSNCGCFWLQGGGTQLEFAFTRRFSAVADLSGGGIAQINGTNERLSFFNYVFGPRYSLRNRSRYTPYSQVMAGGDETFSNYRPYSTGRMGFASEVGGGLDIRVSRYLSLVPVDAGWVYSRQLNGVNTHQNNARLAAGIVLRLER